MARILSLRVGVHINQLINSVPEEWREDQVTDAKNEKQNWLRIAYMAPFSSLVAVSFPLTCRMWFFRLGYILGVKECHWDSVFSGFHPGYAIIDG
jgi:hypothetical protein